METHKGAVLRSGRHVTGSLDIPNGNGNESLITLEMAMGGDTAGTHNPNKNGMLDGSVRPKEKVIHANETIDELIDGAPVDMESDDEGNTPDFSGMVRDIVHSVKESLSSIPQIIQTTISQQMSTMENSNPSAGTSQIPNAPISQYPLPQHVPMQPIYQTPGYARDRSSISTSANESKRNKINMKAPSYDGTTSWPDFLLQFEMASKLNGWSEGEKLLCLGCSLKGVAQEALGDADINARESYKGLVGCLNERFGPEKQEDVFRALLRNRVQLTNESFPELAHAIRRLVKHTYPTAPYDMLTRMAKEHFIEAIGNPETRKWVCFREPKTLDDAVRMAIKVESREEHEFQKGTVKKNLRAVRFDTNSEVDNISKVNKELVNTMNDMRKEMQHMSSQIVNLEGKVTVTDNRPNPNGGNSRNQNREPIDWQTVQCYGCHQYGHTKRRCPNMGYNNQGGYARSGNRGNTHFTGSKPNMNQGN